MFWFVNQIMACVPVKAISRSKSSRRSESCSVIRYFMLLALVHVGLAACRDYRHYDNYPEPEKWKEFMQNRPDLEPCRKNLGRLCGQYEEIYDMYFEFGHKYGVDALAKHFHESHDRISPSDAKIVAQAIMKEYTEEPVHPIRPVDGPTVDEQSLQLTDKVGSPLDKTQENLVNVKTADPSELTPKERRAKRIAEEEESLRRMRKDLEEQLRKYGEAVPETPTRRGQSETEIAFFKRYSLLNEGCSVYLQSPDQSRATNYVLPGKYVIRGLDHPESIQRYPNGTFNHATVRFILQKGSEPTIVKSMDEILHV